MSAFKLWFKIKLMQNFNKTNPLMSKVPPIKIVSDAVSVKPDLYSFSIKNIAEINRHPNLHPALPNHILKYQTDQRWVIESKQTVEAIRVTANKANISNAQNKRAKQSLTRLNNIRGLHATIRLYS